MAERLYRIQKAAELAGLTEVRIRAWERRYSLLRPQRTAGGFRLYTDREVAILRQLRTLSDKGVPISEAVRQVGEAGRSSRVPQDDADAARYRDQARQAGESFEVAQLERVLADGCAQLGSIPALEGVLLPLQREVGEGWEAGALSVAQEHVITSAVRRQLLRMLETAPVHTQITVVCACMPDEQHEIGLLGAALRFMHAGWTVVMLGQRTPLLDLVQAVKKIKPEAVAISCVMDPGSASFRKYLQGLKGALPRRTRLVMGGQGASRYVAACERVGANAFLDDTGWEEILRRPKARAL